MKKKKILFLSPLPPPFYGSAMSSEKCLEILKEKKTFTIENIKINFASEIKDIGRISFIKIKEVFKKRKEIREKIKKFDPDLIYFMPATSKIGIYKDFLFIREIKKNYSKNLVYHIRSRISEEDKKNLIKRLIYKKIFSNSNVIILDELLKKDIEEFFTKKNIFTLPNAIENEISGKEFKRITLDRKKKMGFEILFISNMYYSKGWFKLLEACKILKGKKENFMCNFIGPWPSKKEREIFLSFIKDNSLEKNVKYFGEKRGKEKNSFLEKSDVFVFPTYYELEAHPRVILEAMMFGIPVIANGIASIPSTIKHDKTGFILGENSPEEIAKYIRILIQNPKTKKIMGINARKRFLEKYEGRKYKKEFIRIINKILWPIEDPILIPLP